MNQATIEETIRPILERFAKEIAQAIGGEMSASLAPAIEAFRAAGFAVGAPTLGAGVNPRKNEPTRVEVVPAASKPRQSSRPGPGRPTAPRDSNARAILAYIQRHQHPVGAAEIADKLRIAHRTVTRLVSVLVETGEVQKDGEKRWTKYTAVRP